MSIEEFMKALTEGDSVLMDALRKLLDAPAEKVQEVADKKAFGSFGSWSGWSL